jgi:hypothetical protein
MTEQFGLPAIQPEEWHRISSGGIAEKKAKEKQLYETLLTVTQEGTL